MTDIAGNALTMSSAFGSIGFGTIDPGNGTLEEQICFTGLTNNTNGTTTLTGVSNVSFLYPYTQTSGLAQTHASAINFVISNTSGFYDSLTAKDDDETITGTWTFPTTDPTRAGIGSDTDTATATAFVTLGQLSRQAISGASNAAETVKGIVQLPTQAQVDAKTITGSTGALLALTPDKQRSTLLSDYQADSGSANFIVITPSPAITSYQTGQIFSLKMASTNTSPTVYVNVSGLGNKQIASFKGNSSPLVGDFVSGQLIVIEYNATNGTFQQLNPPATTITTTGTPTQGDILYYNGSAWTRLAAGTSPQVLTSNGAGTNPSWQTRPSFKTGATSRDISTASGAQTIAHGLGYLPKYVRISATYQNSDSKEFCISIGAYDGSTNSVTFISNIGTTGSTGGGNTTYGVRISTAADPSLNYQSGVITMDASNITITWTKVGTPTGSAFIMWEVTG